MRGNPNVAQMHCSPTQQQVISAIVSKQIGFALLGVRQFPELFTAKLPAEYC
jgi:hypothetical protein